MDQNSKSTIYQTTAPKASAPQKSVNDELELQELATLHKELAEHFNNLSF